MGKGKEKTKAEEARLLNTYADPTYRNPEIKPHLYLFSIMFGSNPLNGIYTKEGVVGAQNEHEAKVFIYEQYENLFRAYPVGMSDIKLSEVHPDYGMLAEVTISNRN